MGPGYQATPNYFEVPLPISAGSATASQCDGPQFASDRIPASALQREDPGAPKNAARGQRFFGVEK